MTPDLAVQLDPACSRALVLRVESLRLALGYTQETLGQRACAPGWPVNGDMYRQWLMNAREGRPLRLELRKALAVLAAVGYADGADSVAAASRALEDAVALLLKGAGVS